MSAASEAVRSLTEAHGLLQRDTGVPRWLEELRRDALARFAAVGFPTTREEDWKYTSLRPIERRRFRPVASAGSAGGAGAAIEGLEAHTLVFRNGRFVERLGPDPGEGAGVHDLAAWTRDESHEALPAPLATGELAAEGPLAALNAAFLGDGAVIRVAPGADVALPICLQFRTAGADEPLLLTPRVLISVGRGARVTVIEHYVGEPAGDGEAVTGHFTNTVTDVELGDGATLHHYRLQEQPDDAFHVGSTRVRQQADSRLRSHSIDLGAALARTDLDVRLEQRGAEATLNGFYLTGGRQHVDNHSRVEHLVPHCTSREDFRGVLGGRSRGVFNGKVIVHADAQGTEAHQSNRNLLLSARAEIDTKPELEIYADDVKCSHGATIGQLDRDAEFYLRSRGLDERTTRALLTFAFADEIFTAFESPALRRHVERAVVARLPDSDRIMEFV